MMAPSSLDHWLAYESGMAWCESQSGNKYKIVPFVAEFANTVSNLPLVLLPLLNVAQLWPYISQVNPLALWPHALLALNGLASMYYHATLSLFGQIVDELLILHILNSCMIAYLPVLNSAVPKRLRSHVQSVRLALVLASVVVSALCFLKPHLNAFALMTFSLPGCTLVYLEGTRSGMPETAQFARRILCAWSVALGCWLADRLVCELWLQLGTPYLHAVWHGLSAYAAYNVFCGCSLLDIRRRAAAGQHRFRVRVRYFPTSDELKEVYCSPGSCSSSPCWAFPYLCLESEEKSAE